MCRDGPRAPRFSDGGLFASGSYTALEADYAARYAMMHPPSTNGGHPVILFAVFLSSAYVVTLRDYPPDDPDCPQMVICIA